MRRSGRPLDPRAANQPAYGMVVCSACQRDKASSEFSNRQLKQRANAPVRCKSCIVERLPAGAPPWQLPSERGERIPHAPLRFNEGDDVVCHVEDLWLRGKVIALHYVQDDFPAGCAAAYQVKLLRGCLVYAPFDHDGCIRCDDQSTHPFTVDLMNTVMRLMQEDAIGLNEGDMCLPLNHVRALAKVNGLTQTHHPCSHVLKFHNGNSFWEVDCASGNVTTEITHPRHGRNRRVRPNIDLPLLQNIFRNPRIHTGLSVLEGGDIRASQEHRRDELRHDDLARWEYVLEVHDQEFNLTEEDKRLFLCCCQLWIDNFVPFFPAQQTFRSHEDAQCAMGSLTVRILSVIDKKKVFYDDGHQVPQSCCPRAADLISHLWEDGEHSGGRTGPHGLWWVCAMLAHLPESLRFEFLLFYYGKVTHDGLWDANGNEMRSAFEKTHHAYGINTYDFSAACNICPCHGNWSGCWHRSERTAAAGAAA